MKKFTGLLLEILSWVFIISLVSTLIAYVGNENSMLIQFLGLMGFIGTIITIRLVILHFLCLIISVFLKIR